MHNTIMGVFIFKDRYYGTLKKMQYLKKRTSKNLIDLSKHMHIKSTVRYMETEQLEKFHFIFLVFHHIIEMQK